jgi:hypothetical protein
MRFGMALFRFPLIEPDKRSYRIRLSEKTHVVLGDALCNFLNISLGLLDSSSFPTSFVASCVRL